MTVNNPPLPPSTLNSIKDTISHFYTSVTDGPFDSSALTPTPLLEELLPAVISTLQSSSLAPFLPPKYRNHDFQIQSPPSPPNSDHELDLNLDHQHKPTTTKSTFTILQSQITAATHVAAECIPHHPTTQQLLMAQINLFFVYTEDILDNCPHLLQNFQLLLSTHTKTNDPVLDWFIGEIIPSLYTHFDPLVASMAITAVYEMLNGMVIESPGGMDVKSNSNSTSHLNFHMNSAPIFPDWLRNKTGLSELYAVLVLGGRGFDTTPTSNTETNLQKTDTGKKSQFIKAIPTIPDIIILTNAMNDVISFYKETLAGEQGNYIDMRSHRDGTDILTALRVNADEGIAANKRIMNVLESVGVTRQYRDMFVAYVAGLTKFHTANPRYRIGELFGELLG